MRFHLILPLSRVKKRVFLTNYLRSVNCDTHYVKQNIAGTHVSLSPLTVLATSALLSSSRRRRARVSLPSPPPPTVKTQTHTHTDPASHTRVRRMDKYVLLRMIYSIYTAGFQVMVTSISLARYDRSGRKCENNLRCVDFL